MAPRRSRRIIMLLENNTFPEDVRVRQEAMTLKEAGFQVCVICPRRTGQHLREIYNKISIYRYPAPRTGNSTAAYLWEYGYSFLATFIVTIFVWIHPGFDVIHAANPPDTSVLIASFYKLFGKLYIFDQHDLSPEIYASRFARAGRSFVFEVLLLLEKLSYRLADHVIITNQSAKEIAVQRGQVPLDRLTIVRNGPDLMSQFSAMGSIKKESPDKYTVTYIGIIGIQDGLDYLIRSVRHLVRDLHITNFNCEIIGDGDAVPELKSLTEQLDLSDFVNFAGWVEPSQVVQYLNRADICVAPDPSNPYNDRSTIIKLMEYMALSKPIVAFDLPEHRITANGAAIYAQPNDELDFAKKIEKLMLDRNLRQMMGKIGRQRIELELSWQHQSRYLLSVYDRLLKR